MTELLQLSWEGQVSQDGTELPSVYKIESLKQYSMNFHAKQFLNELWQSNMSMGVTLHGDV